MIFFFIIDKLADLSKYVSYRCIVHQIIKCIYENNQNLY